MNRREGGVGASGVAVKMAAKAGWLMESTFPSGEI